MIFIDASRYSNTHQRTGVENYSYHLINELVRRYSAKITLVSPKKIPLRVKQLIIPFPRLWTQGRLSWEVLKNKKIETLFVPSHLMPVVHPNKTVITIHDVAFRHFPESYSLKSRWYLHWGTKFAVKHAYRIIVPSEVTQNDLINLYGAEAAKINVIPHGYNPLPLPTPSQSNSILQQYNLNEKKYFLFIGRIETKKNLLTLFKAFSEYQKKHTDMKLVIAGKAGVGGNKISQVANKNSNIILTGYIQETEKNVLLSNAHAFVFPSWYEGFGLPLLEAMQFKLPIIASDIPASREVAGKVAMFFHPNDSKDLATKMENVNKMNIVKYNLILRDHSWKQCARQTWETLQP